MLFDVYFTLRGPAGIAEVPCSGNPVECVNLASLLAQLAQDLPYNPTLGLETVGVRVVPHEAAAGGRTRAMTEHDWLTSEDPARMLEYLLAMNSAVGVGESPYPVPRTSDRKLRLWCAACYSSRPPDTSPGRVVWSWVKWADDPSHNPSMTVSEAVRLWVVPDGRDPSQGVKAALLRDVVGNPFRPAYWPDDPKRHANPRYSGEAPLPHPKDGPHVVFRRAWRTPTVLSLARGAYDERLSDGTLDPLRLAVLADALEEAGCDSEELLRHLRGYRPCYYCFDNPAIDRAADEFCTYCGHERWLSRDFGPGPHVRGCWAADLLLGLE
jgi:hypothetical protein